MKLLATFFLSAACALPCGAAELDRTIIPLPEPAFEGKIGETYKDSEGAWPKLPAPPEGAPNVLVILLDDVGFGQTGTFGGPIPTPALDKLTSNGLRYTRFHTTAICGPSRAAAGWANAAVCRSGAASGVRRSPSKPTSALKCCPASSQSFCSLSSSSSRI